eukprot:Em0005g558a
MKILIRSRFPKRLNQIRSAGWLQTFHWIAFEIMPPPAESVSLDSNTCKSDSVEEDPSFEGDAYEFLDHVPLIYRTCLDTLYTITYEASNCAGRNETVIKSWTLPSPPQDIHATHVINIIMQSMHLVVTWTSQLHADNNSYYILNVSSEDGLIFSVSQISMDHCENESSSCYFAQDFNDVTFAKYFVSMASVSGLRTGPFSAQVESLAAVDSSIGAAVGVSVSVAFVVYFCMGVLAASVLCYISRKSKESSHKPSSCGDPATVYEVGTNKKMKEDVFELNTNNTYGSPTVQEVGTNKEMERDVLELNTNTAYGSPTVHEVDTNQTMKEDVLELNPSIAYGSYVSSTVHEVCANKKMEGNVVEMRANTSYVSVYH